MVAPDRNEDLPRSGDALLIVDLQHDFLPGGSLPVPHGDEVLPVLERYLERFSALPVYATRDWHPARHCSFLDQGGSWPPHCVAGTTGAEFALRLPPAAVIVSKATSAEQDAYSGFQGTDLDERLRAAGIGRLYVGGLATDYCVLATVRDALKLGYRVMLLHDAIRAVDVQPGDGERAEAEMVGLGAQRLTLQEICG